MRSTSAARADRKSRNAVNQRRACGQEEPQCGQLAPRVRTGRAAMRSTSAARADRKSRNAVNSRRTCGQEEPQCGQLAPHVRTGSRNAVNSGRTCGQEGPQCGQLAPHVRTGRAAMRSTRTARPAVKPSMRSPRCAGARAYGGSVTPRSVPAVPLTSLSTGLNFCCKVEGRKTSGFGGCRRYGGCWIAHDHACTGAGVELAPPAAGTRGVYTPRANINRKNRRVAATSSRWPLALVDES